MKFIITRIISGHMIGGINADMIDRRSRIPSMSSFRKTTHVRRSIEFMAAPRRYR